LEWDSASVPFQLKMHNVVVAEVTAEDEVFFPERKLYFGCAFQVDRVTEMECVDPEA